MEKAEENIGTSNVENENVELNLGLSLNVDRKEVVLQVPTTTYSRGKGPNGKKTEGLLYPCNKKDEVEIVFLCHGDLLNAAEFIEHASGGYVEHPLNHIFIDGE
ncbi:hypothetical protein KY289_013471 [Solanum tuberosum]|nr:hypothetical protein KY289_013471 [Solanum tuberosum]